jgi:hypothetical protein
MRTTAAYENTRACRRESEAPQQAASTEKRFRGRASVILPIMCKTTQMTERI